MSKNIKEIISDNISKYRKECGFSQKELAEKIGAKNLTTVSSWERGISSPDADTIIKLCTLFNISLNDLYSVEAKDFDLSTNEKLHIKKYRSLDDHGKKTVDLILDRECERIQSDQEYVEFAARGGKIRMEKNKAIEFMKSVENAPDESNNKDLF